MGVIQNSNKNRALLTRTPVITALAFLCCLLWGSATPAIKTGYRLFSISSGDTASQLLFAGIRFTLAGILVVITGSIIGRRFTLPRGSFLSHAVRLSLVQTVAQYAFFYIGLAHTSGVHGAICTATNVFFSILIAVFVFRYETLDFRKLLGCLIGFAGIVLINVSGSEFGGGFSMLGEGFVILSSLSYSFSGAIIKYYSGEDDTVLLSGWQYIIGGIMLAAAGFAAGGRVVFPNAASLLLLLYMAFISATAYTVWSILLKYNPVSRVSIYGFLNPLCGVILSALILNEQNQAFNAAGLISLLLVCLGILIVNVKAEAAGPSEPLPADPESPDIEEEKQ